VNKEKPLTNAHGITCLRELPRPPRSVEETGLTLGFLVELACKTLYFGGVMSLSSIAEELALPVSVAGDVMDFLKKERFAEIKKGSDIRASYIYTLTDLGRERAREYLRFSGYVGPAPVTLRAYAAMARNQSIRRMTVTREMMWKAFDRIILAPGLIDRLGPAVNSGRSIFLYGPSGNGKTFIAERLARVLTGNILIPHGLCVDNQVIRVYDPVNHVAIPMDERPNPAKAVPDDWGEYDRRWVPCERPVVISGGELTLAMLDLCYDQVSKFYEAPLQVKANGGIFLIDDLGRQLVRPFDLLNRWIVPLEKARDYLTLQNGKKFEIPFDQIILFSTNIDPRELADEAFLRRIGYKIKIDYLREEDYVAICRQECERLGLGFQPEAIQYLIHVEHTHRGVPLSACHPNDVLSRVVEICQYNGEKPRLEKELILRACRDYFTEL
jgi:DNA-binding MarR family transcriptional regulator